MVQLSICLGPLKFLLAMFCSFYCRNLTHLLLNLLLSITLQKLSITAFAVIENGTTGF